MATEYYSLSSYTNQSFIVSGIKMTMRFVDGVGWICGIENEVSGIRVVPNLPILRPYGFERFIFVTELTEITTVGDIKEVVLMVL